MKLILENWRRYLKEDIPTPNMPTEEEVLEWIVAHWAKYGPFTSSREAKMKMSKDIYGLEYRDLFANREMYNDYKDKVLSFFSKKEPTNIYTNTRIVKEVPEGHVRINHSTGLHAREFKERQEIIKSILENGLISQPEGRGKYSESPMDIFGVVNNPAAGERNVHNKHFPWITFDVPAEEYRLKRIKPGSVAVINKPVPAEYIVGVNGVPKDFYLEAVKKHYTEDPTDETNT